MTPEESAALRAPFAPEQIGKLPKGGVMLDYCGHAAVTDRLLKIDPEWNWEPFALTPEGLPALDKANNLWIRLTVCGVTRPGVGDGKSAKECIGDAIRNAAMRFGVALDLWSKEELSPPDADATPKEPKPPAATRTVRRASPDSPATRDDPNLLSKPQLSKIVATMNELGMTEKNEVLAFVEATVGTVVESRAKLTKAQASKLIDALEKLKPEVTGPLPVEPSFDDEWGQS